MFLTRVLVPFLVFCLSCPTPVGSFKLFANLLGGDGDGKDPREHPACRMVENMERACLEGEGEVCQASMNPRTIVIGDVHGSATGLLDVLHGANITSAPDVCEWTEQGAGGTILVQIGDIVDRGDQAIEAWRCLGALQASAPEGSKVVRLLGNHELWWLQGLYHMRHTEADTIEVLEEIVLDLKAGIIDGRQHAAFVLPMGEVDILFIHAGIRPKMMDHLGKKLGNSSATAIAMHMNLKLQEHTAQCPGFGRRCPYDDEIFEAGPDRGGRGIGGPFWTDFSVLEEVLSCHSLSIEILLTN